jgi:hypothetical protein
VKGPRPALDRSPIGRKRQLKIFDAGEVFDNALAVGSPQLDPVGEKRPRYRSLPILFSPAGAFGPAR